MKPTVEETGTMKIPTRETETEGTVRTGGELLAPLRSQTETHWAEDQLNGDHPNT